MKRSVITFVVILVVLSATSASAALKIFACEPEWEALAQEIGGPDVSTFSATTGLQDPHQVQARPSLLAKARRADLLICTGAELEIGWLPMIQRQAANPQIQAGQPGYFQAADYVRILEVPTALDRSAGDVHAQGNPHVQTDPRNYAPIAKALAARLAQLDAANAARYASRYADFSTRWEQALARWQEQASSLKGMAIVVHHHSWTYLENWLGLQEIASLEPKPGLPPSGVHLTEVLAQLKSQPVKFIVRTPYNDERASQWLAERAGVPAVMLADTVGGTPAAHDLFTLFDDTLQRLLKAVRP